MVWAIAEGRSAAAAIDTFVGDHQVACAGHSHGYAADRLPAGRVFRSRCAQRSGLTARRVGLSALGRRRCGVKRRRHRTEEPS
jgi:hypothetical protein